MERTLIANNLVTTRDGHLRVWVGSGPYPDSDPNFRLAARTATIGVEEI